MSKSINNDTAKESNKRLKAGLAIMYVGLGINLFGFASLGDFFEGIGLLVIALGIGMVTAGYIYPNTGEELTSAVEEFEEG